MVAGLPLICTEMAEHYYKVVGRTHIHDSNTIINTINYPHVHVLRLFKFTSGNGFKPREGKLMSSSIIESKLVNSIIMGGKLVNCRILKLII